MLQELSISPSQGEFDFCGHLLPCRLTRVNPADAMEGPGLGGRKEVGDSDHSTNHLAQRLLGKVQQVPRSYPEGKLGCARKLR